MNNMKFYKDDNGFTLVELLIVMAIVAILVGITIAGLGYAMRRSRNIARMSAMTNLDRSVSSYYSDNREYPGSASTVEGMVASDGDLYPYLEGSWETPAGTKFYYLANDVTNAVYYMFCVSQEETGTAPDSYECVGSGIGQDGFPTETSDVACEDGLCGNDSEY